MTERLILYVAAAALFLSTCALVLLWEPTSRKQWLGVSVESWLLTMLCVASVGLLFWGRHV